ncbi:MAG: ZIP family metal transporter [Alistipes sp.]|nr:ZIP family metal transporter [Alistipes sp.]
MTPLQIAITLLIPFLGTVIGSASALMLGQKSAAKMQNILLGFASGVMVAAAVWSLLIPAIDHTEATGGIGWVPALVGFLLGMGFMLLLDALTPHLHIDSTTPEGIPSSLGKSTMLMLAVTLHNIPEGMAVGVVIAGALSGSVDMGVAAVMALAAGIALQNIPEGAVISLPLRSQGISRARSFSYGVASGIVEPLSAVVTILLIEHLIGIFPYMLAFAAGAMIYVVVEELIPEAHSGKHSNLPTIGFAIGFAIMMVLDVALS